MNPLSPSGPTLDRLVHITIGGDLAIATGGIPPSPPPPLVPDFTGSPTSGYAPLHVNFTDTTTGGTGTNWDWAFGDGGTSTVQDPSYTYETAGTYSVEMTITVDSTDHHVNKSNYITVSAPAGPASSLLLHFDNPNGFVDSSTNALTITTSSSSATTTSTPKFGVSSMFNDGSVNTFISVSSELIDLHTDDFTIDCWFNSNVTSGQEFIFDSRNGGAQYEGMCFYIQGGLIYWYDGGVGYGGVAYTLNVWNHVELCRSSGTCYFFLNGVLLSTNYLPGSFDAPLYIIGAALFTPPGVNKYSGLIDEFHIIKGAALHTANFTPPTAPYAT